ncbi:MAG: DUF167 domain-containing protein [Candidatus Heimdallarchaeota archaeon]|nr:DUF167 domain-containing protein [Candidatus Heimdallarchaeota archaeon]
MLFLPVGDVIQLKILVKPRSSKQEYEIWDEEMVLKIKAPPAKGKANKEIISYLSDLFDLSSSQIEITSGATSSTKMVQFSGVTLEYMVLHANKLKRSN